MRGKRGVIGVGNQNQNNFGRTVQQTATGMVSHDSRIEQYKSYDSVSHFGHSNVYSNIATSYISDPRSVWMSSDGYHLYIGSSTAVVDENQDNKNGANATAVAAETTYESGEGDAMIIPIPIQGSNRRAMMSKRRRGSGAKVKTVVLDDTELALYGGK